MNDKNKQWFKGIVLQGTKLGTKIGFPTINLDSIIVPQTLQQGVYAAKVKIDNQIYNGALYFGPSFVQPAHQLILEIHIFAFSTIIYNEIIYFQLHTFIREPLVLTSEEEVKDQIRKDIKKIEKLL